MRKVLVVDDDESNAFILAKLLERCGYDAVYELTGEAALKTAAAFEPDVVFIDLSMPVMGGYELARRLREQAASRKLMLVSLTGHARGQGRGDDSVFDDYLLKPADLQSLRRVIDCQDVSPVDYHGQRKSKLPSDGADPMTPEIEQARMAASKLPYGDPTRELLTRLANRLEEQNKVISELQRLTSPPALVDSSPKLDQD